MAAPTKKKTVSKNVTSKTPKSKVKATTLKSKRSAATALPLKKVSATAPTTVSSKFSKVKLHGEEKYLPTTPVGSEPAATVEFSIKAKVPPGTPHGKYTMPYRYVQKISTGLTIEVEKGFKLCYRIDDILAEKGAMLTTAPGNHTEGELLVQMLNCGRGVIDLRDGEALAKCWIEPVYKPVWES